MDDTSRLNLTEIDDFLVVNLPPVVTDSSLQNHYRQISSLVEQNRFRGVILNLESVGMLDFGSLQQIRKICQSNTLLGSATVLAGANPSIAAYLSQISESLDDLIFCQDMASARVAFI